MEGIVKRLLRWMYRRKQVHLWRRESINERNKIVPDASIKQRFNGKCLILIPHSDDEWIGCSQVIKGPNDVVLCNMDMSGGDTPIIHEERLRELKMVAVEFGRKLITVDENKVEGLINILKDEKPNFVFLPHYIDWHPEHIEVMSILKKALDDLDLNGRQFQVAMYQVSCPIMKGITHALSMSRELWKQKWEFFKKYYPTQKQIPYQRFSLNEIINGLYVKSYAAEVFCVLGAKEWISTINDNTLSDTQTFLLKNYLGSIASMRNFIREGVFDK